MNNGSICLTIACGLLAYGSARAQSPCDPFSGNEPLYRQCQMRQAVLTESPDCSIGKYWEVRARTNPMTDKTSCAVTISRDTGIDGGLIVLVLPSGNVSFAVRGNDYPGTVQKIRVDKNPAVSIESSTNGPEPIYSQLAGALKVSTQFIEWPSGAPNNTTLPVCDLMEAIKECEAKVQP